MRIPLTTETHTPRTLTILFVSFFSVYFPNRRKSGNGRVAYDWRLVELFDEHDDVIYANVLILFVMWIKINPRSLTLAETYIPLVHYSIKGSQ